MNSNSPAPAAASKKGRFKTRFLHRQPLAMLSARHTPRTGERTQPVLIELHPEPGAKPDQRDPVRIFVGTEPAQFRAERAFVYSIAQQRDPTRLYKIYLMSELQGYDRRAWKTGFSYFRYLVPSLAEYSGRAIYNDVDQIYLADPAELFDLDMQEKAVLSIDDRETSVMLLDCAKLQGLWQPEDVGHIDKHKYFRNKVHVQKLWGYMEPVWNARDEEFTAQQSKLLHFTTLHKQPWRPFPHDLRYEPHPHADVWDKIEAAADQARFTLFTAQQPSARYQELLAMYATMHDEGRPDTGHTAASTFAGTALTEHIPGIAKLVQATVATTLLDYGSGKATLYQPAPGADPESRFKSMPAWGEDLVVTCYDPGYAPFADAYESQYDGVITTDVLEHIPAEDIQWVLHHLFGHARQFVYAVAACFAAKKILPDGTNAHCTVRTPDWWAGQMTLAARSFPQVKWVLCTQEKSLLAFDQRKRLTKKGIRSRYFSSETRP
jgi:hypothetical protein